MDFRLLGAATIALSFLMVPAHINAQVANTPPTITFANVWYPGWSMPDVGHTIAYRVTGERAVHSVDLIVNFGDQVYTSPMLDDGLGPDETAGDSVYSGILTGLPFGEVATYHAEAKDDSGLVGIGPMKTLDRRPVAQVGSAIVAVDRVGRFGRKFNSSSPARAAGQWPGPEGLNFIFGGGFLVGTNVSEPQVMHGVFLKQYYSDWIPLADSYPVASNDISDSDFLFSFTDDAAPNPIGLQVNEAILQWSGGAASNSVVFRLELVNTSGEDLEGVAASMYLDADIYLERHTPNDDLAGYDKERGLIYIFDGGIECLESLLAVCTPAHVGLMLLSATGKAEMVPMTAASWTHREDPLTDSQFYLLMTSGIDEGLEAGQAGPPSDYRVMISPDEMQIAAGESSVMAFALVFGNSPEELGVNADAIAAAYRAGPVAAESFIPDRLSPALFLGQNYPNPFSTSTTVPFTIFVPGHVEVSVSDVLGRHVATVLDEYLPAGQHEVSFSPQGLPGGAYFYKLETEQGVLSNALFLLH